MTIQIGQHVKCILRTGAMAEGIVEEWDDNIQLRSLDGESLLIIPHPDQDIMLIKVILPPRTDEPKIPKETVIVKNKEISAYEEIMELPTEDPLRLKKLAELKIMMTEQEKKIIAEKAKSHSISETKKVQYGYPQFLAKQSTK